MSTVKGTRDWDRIFRLVLPGFIALLVSVLAAQHMVKALKGGSAFIRWRPFIERLIRGEDIYHHIAYPNPPLLGICLYPLTLLPPVAGAMTWFFLKIAMAALALYWSLNLAAGRDRSLPARATAIVLLLTLRPLMEDLQHGNVNILIMFLATAGLWAFVHERDSWAGLAIALGTTFKVTPALFIPYFAYKRQWRVVAWSVTGLILFLLILPSLVIGPARNAELLLAWAEIMIKPYAVDGVITYTTQINQSLPGLFFRLFTESPGIELTDQPTVYVNWMALNPPYARLIVRGLLVSIVAWLAWVCRTPTTERRDWRLPCEFGLVLIAMLFISERSWKSHYVTMALPFSAVVAHWLLRSHEATTRWLLASSLSTALVLMASTSPELGGWIVHGVGHKYAEAYGMFFLAALIIFGTLSAILLRVWKSETVEMWIYMPAPSLLLEVHELGFLASQCGRQHEDH